MKTDKKITGIIAEYNPFHKGHEYQIKTLKNNGSDYIIAVMSGDFVQRGEMAIIDKYERTYRALSGGVDLVLELPVIFCLSDAASFAYGGVSLLDSLGVVDELCFGIEKQARDGYLEAAKILINPPLSYHNAFKEAMRLGATYPQARMEGMKDIVSKSALRALKYPNAILAIEYAKAISDLHSDISLFPIVRKGCDYNDETLNKDYSSAGAIRKAIEENPLDLSYLSSLPDGESRLVNCIFPDDISLSLNTSLIYNDKITKVYGINEALSKRILKKSSKLGTFSDFSKSVKSKEITLSSVKRLLLRLALDIKASDLEGLSFSDNLKPKIPYARILGFRKKSSELLTLIKEKATIPIISKLKDAKQNPMLDIDIKASNLYEMIKANKYGLSYVPELSKQIIKW